MHIQGKPEEPGRGKEKESSGQGSKGGKKSLNLKEDFPTFLTQEIISENIRDMFQSTCSAFLLQGLAR